ncbi:MAG: DUF3846 domain-containing protein [Eubacterium sp.]|nr:DUF3846 domain-containing protein [Eubacterium sp.]
MKNYLRFENLESKEYREEVEDFCAVDQCDELKEYIINAGSDYIFDYIHEVADNGVDIYTSDLYKRAAVPDFAEFITDSVSEFGIPNKPDIMGGLLTQGEYYYIDLTLQNNLEEIIYNSIIERLKDEVVLVESDKDTFDILSDNIEDYIEEYAADCAADSNLRCEEIYEGFFDLFYEKVMEISEPKEEIGIKKYSDNNDDDDFNLKGLMLSHDEPPKVVKIPMVDELKNLQNAVDGYIEVLPIMNPYNNKEYDLICNEEGKIRGLEPSATIYGKYINGDSRDNSIIDVICGNALILANNGESFASLSEQEIEFWKNQFNEKDKVSFIGSDYLASDEFEFDITDSGDEETPNKNIENSRYDDFEL